jgi:hypothetical protein
MALKTSTIPDQDARRVSSSMLRSCRAGDWPLITFLQAASVALGVGPVSRRGSRGVGQSAPEQVARFREFVEMTDRLLRSGVTTYRGHHLWCEEAETIPGPVQLPRPPITIAAHGPKMLRIAAQLGDGWSSWGGYGIETEERFFRVTRERCVRFDHLCSEFGRDPLTIRHSLVCFPPLIPWESVDYFCDMVGRQRCGNRRVRAVLARRMARSSQ